MRISLLDLLGASANGQGASGAGGIGDVLNLLFTAIGARTDKSRLDLPGETVNTANGKDLEGIVDNIVQLRGILDTEMAGLFASDVAAMDEQMKKARGPAIGDLKETADVAALLVLLTAIRDKVLRLKAAVSASDAEKLGQLETHVSEVIADFTALQTFDVESEAATEVFHLEISGKKSAVDALVFKLNAIVDAERDAINQPVVDGLVEEARAGAQFCFGRCGGLNVLHLGSLRPDHRHLGIDPEVLTAKLAEACVEVMEAEAFSALIEQRQAEFEASDEGDDDDELDFEDDVEMSDDPSNSDVVASSTDEN